MTYVSWIIGLSRITKRLVAMGLDVCLCVATVWLAYYLRLDEWISLLSNHFWRPYWAIGVSVVLAIPILIATGAYRAVFRYAGWSAAMALLKAMAVYGLIYFFVFTIVGVQGVPRTVGILQPLLLLLAVLGSRALARYWLGDSYRNRLRQVSAPKVLIYGAGDTGRQLAISMANHTDLQVVGFVDDDKHLTGRILIGLPVYPANDLPRRIKQHKISSVLLAMPSITRDRRNQIVAALEQNHVSVRTLPSISDLAQGKVTVSDLRELEIDDLLGREPVPPNEHLLHQNITNKVVMVTGAGGSIGSELCRQIIAQRPAKLLLFELSEFALYAIERELRQSGVASTALIIPILGSVLDANKVQRLCQQHCVQTIFHAAAYKHVPMIEHNIATGVWNNVFGTLRLVDAACASGVETFVLISTDKAVRPTNVMGCSKRLAELILQAKHVLAKRLGIGGTKLTMVRFGNVLGSSGSVVPVFREQIKNGGPVTVTHPEIIRYFMTIPEAAQLVIQAGAMGEGGDVMVLDMGEPVKIVDLAKRMIHLSGFSHKDEANPDGDIEIRFTGLRPGEKLYEELLIGDNTLPTSHSRILRAAEHALSWEELEPLLFELDAAIKAENSDVIRALLKKAVPEFEPQAENGDVLREGAGAPQQP